MVHFHEFIKKVIAFLQKPFKENLSFFLMLWLLISAADVFFWSIHGNPVFGAYMGVHGFVYAYVLVCICGLFGNRAKKVYQVVFIALGIVNLIADAFSHYIMHSSLTSEIIAIIRVTNPSEGREFMSMYLKPDIIAFILICIALLPLINWLVAKRSTKHANWIAGFLSVVLLFSIAYTGIRRSKNWETVFLHAFATLFTYSPPEELTPYRSSPSIQFNGDSPQNIVLIIGESLSRNHCELYGYDKETMPLLSRMASDSLVYTFNNISAAYYNTGGAFPRIMSSFSGLDKDTDQWYKFVFLEDITTAMGYKSVWISNQSPVGFYDNPIARIAELSDSLIWVGTKSTGFYKFNYDESVIPPVRDIVENGQDDKTFLVIHLTGQHEDFSSRYPETFHQFDADDYMNLPRKQRQIMADYDNAVLYGDWVVSELMQSFSDKEAIVFFFPDHALDIFDSDPAYVGHARPTSPQSVQAGLQIPFLVYTTASYRKHFPDKNTGLLKAVDKSYNTEDILYTIMDVANASFSDNPSLAKEHSLLF